MSRPSPSQMLPGVAIRDWTTWAIPAALALGFLLRLTRFGLNFPIWWNEAFLAVNFLRRDYAGLLGALDYNQVCPPLFLWAEKAAVDLLGFREWTLRLIPLLAGLLALLLFARLARRALSPTAAFLTVLLLAVAYHPIRLSAEVKPYSVDLLAAVALISLAAAALTPAHTTRALAFLCIIAPLALAASYPSVFVVAGVLLTLASPVLRTGRPRDRALLALAALLSSGTFLLIQSACMGPQGQVAARAGMADGWSDAFPTSWLPVDVARWLVTTHLGPIFAFPVGEEGVLSAITLTLMIVGSIHLAKIGQPRLLALLLLPFALTATAAVIGKYPYGGHPRITQYLVPAIALLAGAGLDQILRRVPSRTGAPRAYRIAAAACVIAGAAPAIGDVLQPYRSQTDRAARVFAREFWSESSVTTLCLRADLGVLPWESPVPEVPVHLCNRAIYSRPPAANTPVRYMVYYSPGLETLDTEPVRRWREHLRQSGLAVRETSIDLDHWGSRPARVALFECAPPPDPGAIASARVE